MREKDYGLTDEQVEREIARLNASEAVALARHEQRLKYRRRQYLYQLRDYEKKGRLCWSQVLQEKCLMPSIKTVTTRSDPAYLKG